MKKLLFLPLILLAACTGSSEPALTALLAVASGQQVLFYQSDTLQPGSQTPIKLVGTWAIGENLVGLQFRRNLSAGGGSDQLWVLSQNRLRRYRSSNFSSSSVGTPTSEFDNFELPTGVDCSLGYLRLGSANLLLVCPNAASGSTALPTVWLIPFVLNTTGLTPAQLPQRLPLETYPAQVALAQNTVRFALVTPSDRLLYLSKTNIGFIDPADPTSNSNTFRTLPNTLQGRIFTDLIFSSGQAVALAPRESSSTTQPLTTLINWNLSSSADPALRTSTDPNLTANTFGLADSSSTTLTLLGIGFAQVSDNFRLPPNDLSNDPGLRSKSYTASVAGLDQYLYITEGGPNLIPRLRVIDTTSPIDALTAQGLRTLFELSFPGTIQSLSYIPVE